MKDFPTKILAATDGSENSVRAVRAAADIASGVGSELHLVHAWNRVPTTRFESFVREQLRRDARRLLEEEAARVEDETDMAHTTHLREGHAAKEILELAGEIGAGLVVIGSRGLGPVGRFFLGSVSAEVVRRASRPVLVMGDEEDTWPPRRLVFADDGSEEAGEAAALAAAIGELCGARGTVVRAYPELPATDGAVRAFDARLAEDEMQREQDALSRRESILKEALGTQVKVRLAEDDSATAVLEAAHEEEGSALIAVGSRDLGFAQRARLGSVSTRVKTKAGGPVLIYPPLAREEEE